MMYIRRILAAALLAAAAVTTFAAWQTRPPRPDVRRPPVQRQENDEEALKELVRQWADAAVHADVQTLDRIQADNFSGSSEGRNFGKRMLREALRSGVMKVASWTIEDVKVEVRGSSAVVTGKSTLTNAVFMGDDYSGEYEWTNRFVKQKDGTWRAVSSQSKRVKK
jgi:ketosteroid isomerase-like protein